MAAAAAGNLLEGTVEVDGVKILAARYAGDLKEQADRLRDQLGSAVVVLVDDSGGSVRLVAAATSDLAGKKVHAGKIIQGIAPLVGGRGGGRPDMAQGGGSDSAGVERALEEAVSLATAQLQA